ncbi:MAG: hypothetical protein QOG78_2479, partial [Rhodospirillaceae bacterium]|nr:hypothetical protein [Rhodospirillaceae bacterium]
KDAALECRASSKEEAGLEALRRM